MASQNNSKLDRESVAKVKAGDIDAFEGIVSRYQDKLIAYARTIVHDYQAASDVVQNSFIKAYVNLNSYKPEYSFSSWIYRIVHNEAINYIKKHKKELTHDDEEWFDQLPDSGRSVTDEVEKKLLEDKTRYLLDRVPLKYREPIILYYFSGHSYSEISDILRIPTATVGTRINRGKKLLKKEFAKEGVDHE